MKTCKFDGPECNGIDLIVSGLCRYHYYRRQRGDMSPKKVKFKGSPCIECGEPSYAVGRCKPHWLIYDRALKDARLKKNPPAAKGPDIEPCPVPGCKKNKRKRYSVCVAHRKAAARYSLEPEEYLAMVESGVCDICGRTEMQLVIDHDHRCCPSVPGRHDLASCGACVRGAICRLCNNALGMTGDNPEILRALANYLEEFDGLVRLRP